MSVRKRTWSTKSGERREAWIVNYSDRNGTRRIQTFDRKRDADAYHTQVKSEIRAGTHTPSSTSPTIGEAADDWLNYVELEGREATTRAQYEQHARLHINPRLGHVKLAQLTTPGIQAFRDDLLTSLSRVQAKKVLTSLKSLLNDAMRRGNVAQNVALGVSIIVAGRDQRKLVVGVDIPTPDEIGVLLGAAHRHRPLIVTAVFSGLRPSELRGLRWADLALKRGELHVRQRADRYNEIGKLKSKAGARVIPIGPFVVNTLKEWKLACPRGTADLVFPNPTGGVQAPSTAEDAIQAALLVAGITTTAEKPKYTLYSLRHFYASWCINRKVDGGLELPLMVVQRRLGHASIQETADTYGHLFPRADDGAELAAAEKAFLG